jgi:TRAP-type C4-dicarboxylate transport system permease small subunit
MPNLSMQDKKNNRLISVNEWAAIIALVAMTVIVLMAVILRYFFGITIRWTGELTRYIFIYLVFLGVPIAFRKESHVIIEYFISFLPSRMRRWLEMAIDISIAVVITAIAISTVKMISGKLGATLSPGLKIPKGYVYAAVPLGIFLLLIEIFQRLIKAKR